jgi:hypothetical protein
MPARGGPALVVDAAGIVRDRHIGQLNEQVRAEQLAAIGLDR